MSPSVTPAQVVGEEPTRWPITIGVALPIPEPFLAELGAYRERFGDPLAHAIVAHITIVPPTPVPDERRLRAVIDHLADCASGVEPFPVVLAGAGTFRPISPVVFVPLAEGEQEVRAVEEAVRCGPLDRQLLFPYHPHVTVAHHLDDQALDRAFDKLADFRASFPVATVDLYEHGADGVWRVARTFALGQGGRTTADELV